MVMPFSRQIEPSALYEAKGHWEALEAHREQGDKSLVVVVDEAQEMTETMLTELRFAVSHQMDSCSLFPLILVGQSELKRTLRLKKYEAVAQRIPLQYHLSGLAPEETKAYIEAIANDGAYYSAETVERAEERGIEMGFSALTGKKASENQLGVHEFVIDVNDRICACPAGKGTCLKFN